MIIFEEKRDIDPWGGTNAVFIFQFEIFDAICLMIQFPITCFMAK